MITQDELRKILAYAPDTGIFTWLVDPISGPRRAGRIAGTTTKNGYRQILINRRAYKAHRLAYIHVFGHCPKELDHANGNPSDNRIDNLRPATRSLNCANRRIMPSSKSRLKCVHFRKDLELWQAYIADNGKQRHLGYFPTKEAAHAAYCETATKVFGDYAKFG